MGTYLPEKEFGFKTKRKFYGFSINPGPFNVKEQTAIVIAASTALLPAYAMDLLAVQRLYFGPNQDPKIPDPNGMNMGWIGALCLILTTQCLGFGFVGFFRRWLVYPAHMWWPVNLVISNLLHTFHSGESGKTTRQRLVFFKWAVLAVTVYQFFPGFIMPVLQSVAFLCLFSGGPSGSLGNPFAYAPTMSPVDPWPLLSQLGSGLRGGGILSMSFDWSSIGSLSPMYTPLWAQLNYFFANFAFTWLIIPLLFTANFWDASKFPVYSTEAFTVNGTFYNISRVLDPVTYQVDPEKYDAYSPIRLSPFWALSYGCAFAAITAAIAHVLLFHGKEVWTNFHYDIPDVHTKLMKRYKEVPLWAYIALLLSALGLSVFTVENWHEYLQLKVCLRYALVSLKWR